MQRSPSLLSALLLGGAVAAQTVHLVGPGGFSQIQAAINAATAGDVVLIQSGTYTAFTLAKDLTLAAAPGATVDVTNTTAFGFNVTVFQPPTCAKVVGLRFRVAPFPFFPCHTDVIGGTVYFADCAFESSRTQLQPALLVQNGRVAMQRCAVIGGGASAIGVSSGAGCDGLVAVNATVAAVDCLFFGGGLMWDFTGRGGDAVRAVAADVHLANCIAVGGNNDAANPVYPPGDGVHVATASRVWLADCQLRGGDGHTNTGGAGLANLGAVAAQEARSLFFGGAGTPTGSPVVGLLVAAPLLGLVGATPPITIGAPWSITYRTAPATLVLALWSDRPSPSIVSLVAEPVWLPGNAFAVADFGVTDANGLLTFPFAVPATPPLLYASCFVQAYAGATLPLRAAPLVGGVVQ